MPYPIPDNLDNIEGWRWYLVPLPDDDQMIQVAWGMWSELTHFWNWGKEGPVPEQSEKAAQLWAAALYEAWRIRDMGFPDLILTYIDEVEGLLRQIRDVGCCGPQDPTEGQFYTDAISDGVGDVPENIIDAGFATDTTDWDGFDAYKCMIAHVIIDDAREKLTRLANLYDDEGLDFIGGAGAAAAILGFIFANLATGGAALVAGIIGATGAAAALYDWLNNVGSTVLTGIASDLDANRDEISCAIFQADGPTAALSAFYSSVGANIGGVAETAVRLLNMGAVVRALYSGRYDQQNVAQALADAGFSPGGYECCEEPVAYSNYTRFGSDYDGTGDWTGGTDLDTYRKRYRSTQLTLSIPVGYRVNGRTLRITATVEQLASGRNTEWQVGYGGDPTRGQFIFPITGSPVEYVREHTIVGTNLSDGITINFRNTSGVVNHAVHEALIEILDDGD